MQKTTFEIITLGTSDLAAARDFPPPRAYLRVWLSQTPDLYQADREADEYDVPSVQELHASYKGETPVDHDRFDYFPLYRTGGQLRLDHGVLVGYAVVEKNAVARADSGLFLAAQRAVDRWNAQLAGEVYRVNTCTAETCSLGHSHRTVVAQTDLIFGRQKAEEKATELQEEHMKLQPINPQPAALEAFEERVARYKKERPARQVLIANLTVWANRALPALLRYCREAIEANQNEMVVELEPDVDETLIRILDERDRDFAFVDEMLQVLTFPVFSALYVKRTEDAGRQVYHLVVRF